MIKKINTQNCVKENLEIELENKKDYFEVENVVRNSFWNVYKPGCSEHFVLHQMRNDENFVRQLDFILKLNNKVIGQTAFYKTFITLESGQKLEVLTLGPICILPGFQKNGYGKILLDFALDVATVEGFGAVVLEGDVNFYGKCGFEFARNFNIKYHDLPDDVDDSFFLCRELIKGYLPKQKSEYQTPDVYMVSEEDVENFDKNFPLKEKKVLPGQIFKSI